MTTKIGFVLLSNPQKPLPSTRISVLNILSFLKDADFEPIILFAPDIDSETPNITGVVEHVQMEGIEIVYFQKVHGPSVKDTVRKLSSIGVKTIYGVCDLVDNEMAELTDATIVVTNHLKNLYEPRLHEKIYVIHDGIERTDLYKTDYGTIFGSKRNPLQAVLVTSKNLNQIPFLKKTPNFITTMIIGYYPPQSFLRYQKYTLKEIASKSTWMERYFFIQSLLFKKVKKNNWNISTVYQHMMESDIGIIPIDETLPLWKLKSENRLTMKMALGLPVIASPIPSYEEVIVQGENGYIAHTYEEWIQYFEELRDPLKRESIGRKARESVINRYSKEEQAKKLVKILKKTLNSKCEL